MAKYTSDAKLIEGAAAAYKDWSNVPGMYKGLDKLTEAGMGMLKEAQVKKKLEEAKLELEKKAKELKDKLAEKKWDNQADLILQNAGTLGDTLYNDTYDKVQEWKQTYLEGYEEKDDRKMQEALRNMNLHSAWIKGHKELNLQNADLQKQGKLSKGMKPWKKDIIGQIGGQEFTKVSRDENGGMVFHVTKHEDYVGDLEVDENGLLMVPDAVYKEMAMLKNYDVGLTYNQLGTDIKKSKNFDDALVQNTFYEKLPDTENEFIAAMSDDVFMNQNLKTMLNESKTLTDEMLIGMGFDDGDRVISATEKANFIDAITDHEHNKFDLETSRTIMAEQLTNALRNDHTTYWNEKNKKDGGGVDNTYYNLGYGQFRKAEKQNEHDAIVNGQSFSTYDNNMKQTIKWDWDASTNEFVYGMGTESEARVTQKDLWDRYRLGVMWPEQVFETATIEEETTTEEETDFDVDTDKGEGDASQPTTIVGTDIDHTIFVNNQDLGASSLNETFAEYKDYIRFNATGKMGRDKVVITGQSKHKPGDELFTLEFDYSNEKKQKKELARFNKWLKTQSWYKV